MTYLKVLISIAALVIVIALYSVYVSYRHISMPTIKTQPEVVLPKIIVIPPPVEVPKIVHGKG